LCTGAGDLEVCFENGSTVDDCYTAIDGRNWSNYGLTYMERARRRAKYYITGVVPQRSLIFLGSHTPILTASDKGRLCHYYIICSYTIYLMKTFIFLSYAPAEMLTSAICTARKQQLLL
jgi:hypothetical protein